MAIADVYDALISVRPYKRAFSTAEAERIINEGAGTHFDAKLVGVFNAVSERFAEIARSTENKSRLCEVGDISDMSDMGGTANDLFRAPEAEMSAA
jgi:putative two-component system response regulator